MQEYDIRKTQYAVADFVSWQKDGAIDLNPPFQRRSVWKPDAKSYFIDTVVRGLPAPIIYLRQTVDLGTQRTNREVVDGQQRLRTIFTYINPDLLQDFDQNTDAFAIRANHNATLAGKSFPDLSKNLRTRILEYEFSVHILPVTVEDQEVLEMFARLNATGTKLNQQELRNAEFFGEFKTSMYELALEQLQRWRDWKIFSDDQISRMHEVEVTSDLVINMIDGLSGKTQKRISDYYEAFNETFPKQSVVENRFRYTMDQIDALLGTEIQNSVYSSEVFFFSLFGYVYDLLWGLGSDLRRNAKPVRLRKDLSACLLGVGEKFETQEVPANVLDAVQRASSDYGRRKTRLAFIKQQCDG